MDEPVYIDAEHNVFINPPMPDKKHCKECGTKLVGGELTDYNGYCDTCA